jgi:hypothetical protein
MDDSWHFIYVTDMQPGSPRSYRFRPAFLENWITAREQIIDLNPEFILVGGDITRDGTLHTWELEEMKDDLDSMGIPYHAIPGNMDVGNKFTDVEGPYDNRHDTEICITSELIRQYESVFGPSHWSHVHENLRVSGFCDMLLGSGLPEEAKLLAWLDEQRTQPKSEHHIWLMHSALFIEDAGEPIFDIREREQYHHWYFTVTQEYRSMLLDLFRETSTDRVITGHIHCRKDHRVGRIHFDLAPATSFSQWKDWWPDGDPTLGFYEFGVNEGGLHKTFVPLARLSGRTDGYGPGGHPLPGARDYSMAWEK